MPPGIFAPSIPVLMHHFAGRVFGVQGVRVVDASAFPLLPPGQPQATVCKSIRSKSLASL